MADAPASLEWIYRVSEALKLAQIPYAFIGGVAVVAWGIPRQTFDLDLVVSVPEQRFDDLVQAFARHELTMEERFRRGHRDRIGDMEKVRVYLPAGRTLIALDVYLATTPFLKSALDRRVATDLGRGNVFVCAAADLILLKLMANRRKALVDIENVLTIQGVPERHYLERWAERLGMRERLEEVLAPRDAS